MSQIHVVLDTSAIIKRYKREKGEGVILKLFECPLIAKHLPNVCIPEVIAVIFGLYVEHQISKVERDRLKNFFIGEILSHKIVVHNITDGDVRGTDDINEHALGLPPRIYKDPVSGRKIEKGRLSAVDSLVISACREIGKDFPESVFLFTADELMRAVALNFKLFAINPVALDKKKSDLFVAGKWPTCLKDIWPQAPEI